ncbi:MAG: phosphomannomutase/phosphoglucomutase [Pseudomonadota bacterium]
MEKNKERKAKRKMARSPERKRIFQYIFLAILVSVCLALVLWRVLLIGIQEESFDKALNQLVQQRQQVVLEYKQSSQAILKAFVNDPDFASALENKASTELVDTKLQKLQNEFPFAKLVSVYRVGDAQREKDAGGDISFVQVDMINRAESNAPVYPEVSKLQDTQEWIIHWVSPVYAQQKDDAVGDPEITAVVYLSSSVQGLKASLSQMDLDQANVLLIQNIGTQRFLTFLNLGQGGGYGTKSVEVPQSHWQIEVSPSAKFVRLASPIPWWFMLAIAASFLVTSAFAFFAAQRKNKQVAALYSTLEINLNKSANPAEGETDNLQQQQDLSNPIYLSDSEIAVEAEDEDLLAGVYQDKQSSGTADQTAVKGSSQAVVNTAMAIIVPDHIFRAYDIRGIVNQELTPVIAEALGRAVASEALAQGEKAMLIGHDARTHSPLLYDHLKKGILSTGCDVIAIGLVPTPLLSFATVFSDATSSGVIVTASHNPKDYNGFKVAINERTLLDQDIQRLKWRISTGQFTLSEQMGSVQEENVEDDYRDTIVADIAINSDLHIVIDAANGAAGNLAPKVFDDLGCKVTPLFCDVDGEFPNHDPDPSVIENLQPLIEAVKSNQADVGIGLDGDGDRIVVISASGQIIWPDQLLMMFARDVVSRNPGCDVIFDVKSTRRLSQIISRYGGRPVMWKTGHSHIKSKMRETNALLAGEFSGHIFFRERWFGFDDGIYAAARLLEIMSIRDQSLDEMLESLPSMVSTTEIKIAVSEDRKFELIDALISNGDFAPGEVTTMDGLRVDFGKGWGLVRASNTSPALTLRFEAESDSGIEKIKTLFKRELIKVDETLDVSF